jgi:hypothetical protein
MSVIPATPDGCRDWWDSRPPQAKSLQDPTSTKKAGLPVIPVTGDISRRTAVLFKNNKAKNDWGHDSSYSTCLPSPSPWVQTPEPPKKKKVTINRYPAGHCWLMPKILLLLLGRQRSGGSQFEANPGQIVQEILSRKYTIQNRTGRADQVVECLPSKHEVWV